MSWICKAKQGLALEEQTLCVTEAAKTRDLVENKKPNFKSQKYRKL